MNRVVERAAALQKRALVQCSHSRFDLAGRGLLKALESLADPDISGHPRALAVKVRVLVTLSTVEAELRGRQEGIARLAEAQRIVDELAETGLAFAVDNAMALRLVRSGAYEDALDRFSRAEQNISAATASEACILYLNRGNLRLQRLELEAARRDLDRAIALAAAEDDAQLKSWEFMARHNLGYLEFLRGHLPRSLQIMDEAANMPVGVSLAISALDRARVLLEAGLSDAADRSLLSAEAEFRRGRLHHELAETQLARAECAILASNLKAARALASSARWRFKRRGDDRWRRVAELTLISAQLADGRPPTRLIGPATRLAAEFAEQGLDLQAKNAELIACAALVNAGRTDQARARFALLAPISRSDPIAVRLQQRAVAGALLKASGQHAQARSQIRTGLTELSRYQAQFGSIDLQTASAIHGRQLVHLDLELALSEGRPAGLFNAIERGRATSRRLTAITPPSGESAELLAELRQLTEIIKMMGDDPAAASQVSAMRQRTSALYSQLSAISWRAVGVGNVIHPAAMRRVTEAAEQQGKVLVSFCQFNAGWAAVVLGMGRPRLVTLPGDDTTVELSRRTQADLNVLAFSSLPNEMRLAATASLNRSLQRLDDVLIAPLRLADQSLVIVPTGPTATLPWSCLPSLRGRPVEVSPTATSWLSGTLALDTPSDTRGNVQVETFSGPGLDTASQEATEVARVWAAHGGSPTAHTGERAARAQLSRALTSATVVHVAAHGSHMRQNPLFSSLQLADGPLFAYEIADAQVPPHVVLSACELGQATMRSGDEGLGLTRVLLQLGTQCVVAGVAQVADEHAGVVMADYHRRLADGADSATALAAATATGPYAPFVCFGSAWSAAGESAPARDRSLSPSKGPERPTHEPAP